MLGFFSIFYKNNYVDLELEYFFKASHKLQGCCSFLCMGGLVETHILFCFAL